MSKKMESDVVRLKMENKQLEQDMDNLVMKNNILLKMSQKMKKEVADYKSDLLNLRLKVKELEHSSVQNSNLRDKSSQQCGPQCQELRANVRDQKNDIEKFEGICEELNSQVGIMK